MLFVLGKDDTQDQAAYSLRSRKITNEEQCLLERCFSSLRAIGRLAAVPDSAVAVIRGNLAAI